ncbi:MAG: hypothetical protein ABFR32_02005 [Bacteroidota bacterium]
MDPHFKQNIILFAEVIVPEIHVNDSLKYAFIKNFKQVFQGLEKESAAKIKLLIKLIENLSYIYNFKSFENLSNIEREKYINKLFQFPVGKIVGGLTGLRSLIFISYYSIADIWPNINYDGPINSSVK